MQMKQLYLFDTSTEGKGYGIHRLVALTFIPNPENKPFVNHQDGNKQNNSVDNLEWCTNEENQRHSREVLGNTNRGVSNGNYGYRKSRFYPSESLRSRLIELGVPRNKHGIVSLGEMLPYGLWYGKDHKGYSCWNQTVMSIPEDLETNSETLPDCLAQTLIWLIKNNYIDVSKLRSDL